MQLFTAVEGVLVCGSEARVGVVIVRGAGGVMGRAGVFVVFWQWDSDF